MECDKLYVQQGMGQVNRKTLVLPFKKKICTFYSGKRILRKTMLANIQVITVSCVEKDKLIFCHRVELILWVKDTWRPMFALYKKYFIALSGNSLACLMMMKQAKLIFKPNVVDQLFVRQERGID